MLTIDGSHGEGGGQILRSSLALSIVTGTPFRIDKIRAGRKKSGLMRQHLTAVTAAGRICNAQIDGACIGSTALSFTPQQAQGGDYHFSIGTAGSTTLVLQTVLLPLLLADRPSRLVLEGGTHNPFAPPFDFLERAYLPLVARTGAVARATLERPGFFPAGGGRMVVEIEPVAKLQGFDLLERGAPTGRRARALVANLPRHIGEREITTARCHLEWPAEAMEVVELVDTAGPGNALILELEYENVTEVFVGIGELNRSAETVARATVQQCQRYLKSTAPAGEYLTDQLMLPLAIAGSGSFLSTGLSLHAQTHMELIGQFLEVPIESKTQPTGEVLIKFG